MSSGEGDSIVVGDAAAQSISSGAGNDTLVGGGGDDVLQGGRSDQGQWNFFLNAQGQVVAVHNATETMQLAELDVSVPALGFAAAGQGTLTYLSLVYDAAFNRAPDLAGLTYWTEGAFDNAQFLKSFASSAEWNNGLGKLSNADFVDQVYLNALGRTGTATQTADALAQLAGAPDSTAARLQVFEAVALSGEHRGALATTSGIALGSTVVTREQGWIRGGGNDRLDGGAGNDLLVGGDGVDTVVYSGQRSQYKILLTYSGELVIADRTSTDVDVIRQIEQAQFSDGTVNVGFTQASAEQLQQVGLLYQSVLGRAADLAGIEYWTTVSNDALTLAARFLDSAEFRAGGAALDDAAFVRLIQENALNSVADAGTLQIWTGYLETHSRAELVVAFVGSADVVAAQYGVQGLWLA